ncbi:FHA domain-containing protein [Streptomyces sp. NPDC059917]|uniref:FHA domain-containing protein n=1 Tax=Streptomyces sp. NPDC059917 TaxID=3347002 RepID=UPI00364FACAA
MSRPGSADGEDAWDDDGDDWEEVSPIIPVRTPPVAGPVVVEPRPHAPSAALPAVLRFLEVPLTVTVVPGTAAGLGRDPNWAPDTAAALAHHRTVSGRHAEVAVAPDGSATVTEELPGAVNGTRLNGNDLMAGRPYPLTDGDRLRLGPRVSCTVQLGRRA